MSDCFYALNIIAEQRICEARDRGEFENLAGEGRPLPEEDLSGIPPEMRMAWRILKNSGCIPENVAIRKEMGTLCEMMEGCPDEKERLKAMTRLKILLNKMGEGRNPNIEANDEYYHKILAILEKHERRGTPERLGG